MVKSFSLFKKLNKRNTVGWVEEKGSEADNIFDVIRFSARITPAAFLCVLASEHIIRDVFPDFKMKDQGIIDCTIVSFLLIFVFCFLIPSVGLYIKERFRKLFVFALMLISFLITGKIYLSNLDKEGWFIEKGAKFIYRSYLQVWNFTFRTSFQAEEGVKTYAGQAMAFIVIGLFIIFIWFSAVSENGLFVLFPPIILIAMEMIVGFTPEWTGFIFILAAFVIVRVTELRQSLILLGAVVIVSLVVGGVTAGYKDLLMEKSWEVKRFQASAERQIEVLTIGGFYNRYQSVNNFTPEYGDKTVAELTCNKQPETNIYLKEYAADTYSEQRWDSDNIKFVSAIADNNFSSRDALKVITNEVFSRLEYDDRKIAEFKLRYKRPLGVTAMYPYFASVDSLDEIKLLSDMKFEKSLTDREYTWEAYTGNDFPIDMYMNLVSHAEDKNSEIWDWYKDYVNSNYVTVPDNSNKIINLIKDLKVYYPHELLKMSDENGKLNNDAMSYLNYLCAIKISEYLSRNYEYTLSPGVPASDKDPVDYFLFENMKGFCVHFASAGVMILRTCGVPARYVSGYIVKKDSFKKEDDGLYHADIIDRNAHSWVEIYLDRVGWIPVEMTKGYRSEVGSLPTERQEVKESTGAEQETTGTEQGNSGTEQESTGTEQESTGVEQGNSGTEQETTGTEQESPSVETMTENADGSDPSGNLHQSKGAGISWGKVAVAAMILLLILIPVLIIYLRRNAYIRIERMLDELRDESSESALGYLNRVLYRKAKVRKGLSDEEYAEQLCISYPFVSENPADPENGWKRYVMVLQKLTFSKEKLVKEEAEICEKLLRAALL